jgi:hypothetical protein
MFSLRTTSGHGGSYARSWSLRRRADGGGADLCAPSDLSGQKKTHSLAALEGEVVLASVRHGDQGQRTCFQRIEDHGALNWRTG